MKKVIAIFAIAALSACGGKGTTTEGTDSTAVVVDSTSVGTSETPQGTNTDADTANVVK